jgi:hypothetical protein
MHSGGDHFKLVLHVRGGLIPLKGALHVLADLLKGALHVLAGSEWA